MVEQITFQTIFQFLQTVGILVGVYYYIMTIRTNQRNQELARKAQEQALETRQAQLFMNVYQEWISKDNLKDSEKWYSWEWTDYDDFFKKYDPIENPDEHASWDKMLYYFSGLGLLLKQELVNPESVAGLLGGPIILLWEKYSPLFMEMRERTQLALFVQNFEYLYHKMNELIERPDIIVPR